jgi:hypothetical protein
MFMHKDLQKQFIKFHDTIRTGFDDNAKLREKRDLLIEELRVYFKRKSKDEGIPEITFHHFNQGSYGMGIGIKPMPDEDYDIDVALVFHFGKEEMDPIEIKKMIRDALSKGNRTVKIRKPCVRVQYHKDGTESFHVDFAVYSDKECNEDEKFYLARGNEEDKSTQYWEESDPEELKRQFNDLFKGDDHKQFVRVIRGMKRWKDNKFEAGDGRPIGIAITACAMKWFSPDKGYIDGKWTYNDCAAKRSLVNSMINNFTFVENAEGKIVERLIVRLTVLPKNDLFEKMSDTEMSDFKKHLINLRNNLDKAMNEETLRNACLILRDEFGGDFPVPDEEVDAVNNAFKNNALRLVGTASTKEIQIQNRGGFHAQK